MRANWACLVIGASLVYCAAADEALSSDFLEFLGDGSQLDAQWIDPMSLHESPEAFAALPTSKHEPVQRTGPDQPEDSAPTKDSATPPHSDDGGHKND
jgi:hypothetical protein